MIRWRVSDAHGLCVVEDIEGGHVVADFAFMRRDAVNGLTYDESRAVAEWMVNLHNAGVEWVAMPRFRVERGTSSDGRNTTWEVWDRGENRNCRIARFDYNHPNSARAAQIEADRLNGEALL